MKTAPEQLIPFEVLEHSASVLKVLAHPHRLMIVDLLRSQDLTVGELAERLELAPHACSQHLNLMKAHGILAATRHGRAVQYEVINPNALNVLDCIRKHACPKLNDDRLEPDSADNTLSNREL